MMSEFEGKIIADKYRVDTHLHESDLGSFYRGWHELMDKLVILQVLAPALAVDQRLVDRFIAEARTRSRVINPNVLALIDFGTDSRGLTYAVYEGVSGDSLNEIIRRDEVLPLPLTLQIAEQAAAGLAAAHAGGLRHGSLNPDKILVNTDQDATNVRVFDFGAEPVGRNSLADFRYLSPEQYDDPGGGDDRTDIYSLGVIIYEMLTGTRPYTGSTAAELREVQASQPPTPLSAFRDDLPKDLEPMILSAMSLDPDRRYQEMGAFAEDLATLRSLLPGERNIDPETAVALAQPKRNIWQTAFIVLAGISIVAAALIYGMSGKKTDPTTQLQAEVGSFPVQPIGPATGAQEETLARMPSVTDAEIMALGNMAQPPGTLAGGDGYNAWANGGAPPPGAPTNQYVPPGGQYYTIDPNTGSPFMPSEGGVILVPVPANTNTAVKTTPTPKGNPANSAVKPPASPEATPRTFATPVTDKPGTGQPAKTPPAKGKSGKRTDS
jgi:Protein kinase domain